MLLVATDVVCSSSRKDPVNSNYVVVCFTEIRFADGRSTPPVSVCSDPCGPGEAKSRVSGSSGSCCWNCVKCTGDQVRRRTKQFHRNCSFNYQCCGMVVKVYVPPSPFPLMKSADLIVNRFTLGSFTIASSIYSPNLKGPPLFQGRRN